jgi:hypothetical protein
MCDETKKWVRKNEEYLGDWLADLKKRNEIAPNILEMYENSKWARNAISNAPPTITTEPLYQNLGIDYKQDFEYLKDELPPISQETQEFAMSLVAGTTASSTTATYDMVGSFRNSDDPIVVCWSEQYASKYEHIQESDKRHEEVRSLLHSLKPELADLFDIAEKEYRATLVGSATYEAAALAMRNVHEKYKGELCARATKRTLSSRNLWAIITDKLSRGPKGSVPYHKLRKQGEKWKELQSNLSNIAKRKIQVSAASLTAIHTEFLDHLYVVLSLSNIE